MTRTAGLLDTSVVIDLPMIPRTSLPKNSLISSLTLAELIAGIPSAKVSEQAVLRRDHILEVQEMYEVIPFDSTCAHAYLFISQAVATIGRKLRGRRAIDYLIATTAARHGLPLFTRNPRDFEGLEGIIEIVAV